MLLNAKTDNGNGPAIIVPADSRQGVNPRLIWVKGTFDSATVNFEHSFDGGATWIDATGVTFTTEGVKSIYLASGQKLRAVVAGGSQSTQSLSANLV